VSVLGGSVPVRSPGQATGLSGQPVDVLVRPEGLRLEVAQNGNGIVTTRTFLGSVTRVGVLLDGDVALQVDKPSSEAAALPPGASVAVTLPSEPVHVAARRVSQ
jgi:putative spermidine/putrescine transport system ATP-binding protein